MTHLLTPLLHLSYLHFLPKIAHC